MNYYVNLLKAQQTILADLIDLAPIKARLEEKVQDLAKSGNLEFKDLWDFTQSQISVLFKTTHAITPEAKIEQNKPIQVVKQVSPSPPPVNKNTKETNVTQKTKTTVKAATTIKSPDKNQPVVKIRKKTEGPLSTEQIDSFNKKMLAKEDPKIKSQMNFKQTALTATSFQERVQAATAITDPNIYAILFLQTEDRALKRVMLKKITDKEIGDAEHNILEYGLQNSDREIRMAALKNIYDQKKILELVRNDLDKKVRRMAISKLINQDDTLRKLILEDEDDEVIGRSIRGLNNTEYNKKFLEKVRSDFASKDDKSILQVSINRKLIEMSKPVFKKKPTAPVVKKTLNKAQVQKSTYEPTNRFLGNDDRYGEDMEDNWYDDNPKDLLSMIPE